jgi:DNA polymerase-1
MQNPHDTIYLIDGSGYIFRAFYAIQRLSTKSGFPTNALYGFLKMILKTISVANSSKIAIIFDAGRKTFRNDLYPEYKANRTECPPELVEQMPYFRDLSKALGLTVLECPGYEADDIIATLTSQLSHQSHPVVIVSGDKDLMQLVNEKVQIWDTMKDKRYARADVIEKFGVGPEQVTEILALTPRTTSQGSMALDRRQPHSSSRNTALSRRSSQRRPQSPKIARSETGRRSPRTSPRTSRPSASRVDLLKSIVMCHLIR